MKVSSSDIKENVFRIIQEYLKNPPLIVWGSGATIPFGIPGMGTLNEKIKSKINGFNAENENLEIELGKEKYKNDLPNIKKIIWKEINEADIHAFVQLTTNNAPNFKAIRCLVEKFLDVHPRVINIVTTNYDRILEYILSYNDIPFTDGFTGKALSYFNENLFQAKDVVNLIKVHGSLNWFNVNDEIRYINSRFDSYTPQIIAPGRNKYQESYNSPHRELIQKADLAIKNALSFLVVGFGFNDEHLTPRIRTQIKKGVPLVLITKKITKNTFIELEKAEKYILIEEEKHGLTNVVCKLSNSDTHQEFELNGDYWQLPKFMEIL